MNQRWKLKFHEDDDWYIYKIWRDKNQVVLRRRLSAAYIVEDVAEFLESKYWSLR